MSERTILPLSSSGKPTKPKRGWSVWVEAGVYFSAPKVNARRFGEHAYAGAGYANGVHDCPCGCYMMSASSGGPVDPFGPCPRNPKGKS